MEYEDVPRKNISVCGLEEKIAYKVICIYKSLCLVGLTVRGTVREVEITME